MEIKLRDTDTFKEMTKLLADMLSDEDTPQTVRFKYFLKLDAIKEDLNAHKNSQSDKS